MNVMKRVTIRHLRENKKRTIVTILGVMVSVAMMTAIIAGVTSLQDCLYQNALRKSGRWHVLCKEMDVEEVKALQREDYVASATAVQFMGYSMLEGSGNKDKPYLSVNGVYGDGYKENLLTLIEGRFPENDAELVVSKHMMENGKVEVKVGDVLTLSMGKRVPLDGEEVEASEEGERESSKEEDSSVEMEGKEWGQDQAFLEGGEKWEPNGTMKEYTVVGVVERPFYALEPYSAPGYSVFTLLGEEKEANVKALDVYVYLSGINRKSIDKARDFYSGLGNGLLDTGFIENTHVLLYYGASGESSYNQMIFLLAAILLSIAMIGSISLIYNAFAISMSEKGRQLGMLASVGATRRQKRTSIYYEGLVIGMVGIPFGILFGLLGLGITFWLVGSMVSDLFNISTNLRLSVPLYALPIIIGFSALTIWLSMYMPARRASKITPLEAIRQSKDVKLTKRSIKVGKLQRMVYGFEGVLAIKNLKRNRKRYRATVFSIFICVVLFLTIHSYGFYLKKGFILDKGIKNYDLTVYKHLNSEEDGEAKLVLGDDGFLRDLKGLEGIREVKDVKRMGGLWVEDGLPFLNEELIPYLCWQMVSGDHKASLEEMKTTLKEIEISVSLIAMDEAYMREYGKKQGFEMEEFYEPNAINGILLNRLHLRNGNRTIDMPHTVLKKGDRLPLSMGYTDDADGAYITVNLEKEEKGEWIKEGKIECNIMGEAKEYPMGIDYGVHAFADITILVSKENLKKVEEQVDMVEANRKNQEKLLGKTLCNRTYKDQEYKIVFEDMEKAEKSMDEYFQTLGGDDQNLSIENHTKNEQSNRQALTFLSIFAYGFIILFSLICIANIFNTITTSFQLRLREFAMLKSVGMTNASFRRMVAYESLFYGLKALAYGLPAGIVIMVMIHRAIGLNVEMPFTPSWAGIAIVVSAVFTIVGSSMAYSLKKLKGKNLIDILKKDVV